MHVTIRVPATVANLGPGFDILALAIQLQNEVEAWSEPDGGITVDPGPGGSAELRDPARNLVARALVAACEAAGTPPRECASSAATPYPSDAGSVRVPPPC